MTIKFCPKCGTPPNAGARFCSECGLDFSTLAASQPAGVTNVTEVKPPVIERPASLEPSAKDVLLVSQQGDGDYTTIAEALNHAKDGSHVVVRKGVYAECLSLRRPVTLVAEEGTPREHIMVLSYDCAVLHVSSNNVFLRGMSFVSHRRDMRIETISPQGQPTDSVICIDGSDGLYSVNIDNCIIKCDVDSMTSQVSANPSLSSLAVRCIYASSFGTLTLRGCLVEGGCWGICAMGDAYSKQDVATEKALNSQKMLITNCEVRGFTQTGIEVHGMRKFEMVNSQVYDAALSNAHLSRCGILLSSYSENLNEDHREEIVLDNCDIRATGWHGGIGL